MDTSLLMPDGPSRNKQVQDARDMFETIKRNAEKSGSSIPPYEFLELIGKGAFGRVYKCRHTVTSQLVAVKILNIDDADFDADPRERDETVKDFRKEVEILTQLKDFKAKNVNMIHDAFDLHSQLWIVSDFCTGGSVRTLMRANPRRGLEEKYLIPIARELAIALKSVHDIGVIHRDIKCANVYITEDGRIQLGDFGVVGIMDNGIAKRTTIIGTPWYMPKEMHVDTFSVTQGYGKEVDIWAYGCTIFEMATGYAPNATVAQHMLGTVLDQQAPRLLGDEYSDDLRDFVAFCLDSNPATRPSADQILKQSYISGTKVSHPTQSLVALIDRYIVWEHRGGQRTSLFNPGGAAAPISAGTIEEPPVADSDDWNFNTTDGFYGDFAKRYSQMVMNEDTGPLFEAPPGSGLPPAHPKNLTPLERIQREHAAKSESRGERSLGRLWDPDAPYDPHSHTVPTTPVNDLPLREYSSNSAPRESTVFIDLDTTPAEDPGPAFNFDFDNILTVKAKQKSSIAEEAEEEQVYQPTPHEEKRSTMAWTFPIVEAVEVKRATMDWTWPGEPATAPLDAEPALTINTSNDDLPPGFRPQLKHTATAPLGQFGDFIHTGPSYLSSSSPTRDSLRSLIDLDLSSDLTDVPRPSTAVSHTGSISTIMTSGPFDLEDRDDFASRDTVRSSVHKQWQSDGANRERSSLYHIPLHERGVSLSSTDSEYGHRGNFADEGYPSDLELEPYPHEMPRGRQPTSASETSSTWFMVNEEGTDYSTPATPHFGEFSFPSRHNDAASTSHPSMQRGFEGQNNESILFPMPQPPRFEALLDGADEQVVMGELQRLLKDAGDAFESTALAIQQHMIVLPEHEYLESSPGTGVVVQPNGH